MPNQSINNWLPIVSAIFCVFLTTCSKEVVIDSDTDHSSRGGKLNILSWSEYIAPSVIEKFERDTGIAVTISNYENTDEFIAVCEAENHKYDLLISPFYTLAELQSKLLISKLDQSRINQPGGYLKQFRNLPHDPEREYSIPYFWGTTIVAYRSDRITNPKPSFQLLFDERVKGKAAMLSDHDERFALAHLLRGVDINERSDDQLKKSAEILKAFVKDNDGVFISDQGVRDRLKDGSIWAAHCYNGDAAMIAKESPAISYFTPTEGATLWCDTITLTKESHAPDIAYQFINFLNRPEIAAENANWVCYAPARNDISHLIKPELLNDPAIFPDKDTLARCSIMVPMNAKTAKRISELSRNYLGE